MVFVEQFLLSPETLYRRCVEYQHLNARSIHRFAAPGFDRAAEEIRTPQSHKTAWHTGGIISCGQKHYSYSLLVYCQAETPLVETACCVLWRAALPLDARNDDV